MSPDEFEKSLEFSLLTPAEREFVVMFIETRDINKSVLAAYPRAVNQTRLRAHLLNNRRVNAALNAWFGKPQIVPLTPKEEAIAGLKSDIRRLKGTARVQAKRLLFQLEGIIQGKK